MRTRNIPRTIICVALLAAAAAPVLKHCGDAAATYGATRPKEYTTMRNKLWMAISIFAALLVTGANAQRVEWNIFAEPFISSAHAQDVDWQKVDETLGRKPAVSGDVHRYGFPRTDLSVTLDGVTIKPALALGGWVAFKPMHGGAMVMGDLVLLETEINPVMAKMIAGGLEITAVHNHLLRASPATFYMHVAGHGDPAKLAAAIHDALAESKTPLTVRPQPSAAAGRRSRYRAARPDHRRQGTGQWRRLPVQRAAARSRSRKAAWPLSPVGPMGVATGINFQPTGGGKAAITGDFVLTGDEVNPVIKALRANGIEVTALHSHMLDEAAAAVLHAFLGQRRRDQARQGPARGARQDGKHEELSLVQQGGNSTCAFFAIALLTLAGSLGSHQRMPAHRRVARCAQTNRRPA